MSPHNLHDSPKYTPSITLQCIFDFWSSSFCYEQPIYVTHSLRNKNIVTLHKIVSVGCFREPYVQFISSILFKGIIHRLSFIINLMFLPKSRIRVITYLTIFSLHFVQHIISHSINHLLIWHLSLQCIYTICSGIYQNNNIIVIIIIEK